MVNREIKFRAWDYKNNEMIEEIQMSWCSDIEDRERSFDCYLRNKEFEVMQYTGNKDQNGTEIYEGDIMSIDPKINHIPKPAFEIKWCDFFGGFNLQQHWIEHYIVIGNIYENAKLIR